MIQRGMILGLILPLLVCGNSTSADGTLDERVAIALAKIAVKGHFRPELAILADDMKIAATFEPNRTTAHWWVELSDVNCTVTVLVASISNAKTASMSDGCRGRLRSETRSMLSETAVIRIAWEFVRQNGLVSNPDKYEALNASYSPERAYWLVSFSDGSLAIGSGFGLQIDDRDPTKVTLQPGL